MLNGNLSPTVSTCVFIEKNKTMEYTHTTKPKLIARINSNIGKKFNRLTIVSFNGISSIGAYRYNCICDCGNKSIISISLLKNNHVKSCGCLQKEHSTRIGKTINKKHGDTVGHVRSRIFVIWSNMLNRCNNIKSNNYKYYGERGIIVYPGWSDYTIFKTWALENGYSDDLTLDRINSDGNYEPGNCRWATRTEQANNRGKTIFLDFNGEKLPLADWSRRLGIAIGTIHSRLRRGWTIEKTLSKPILKTNRLYKKI